jgi:hypothetical protein
MKNISETISRNIPGIISKNVLKNILCEKNIPENVL